MLMNGNREQEDNKNRKTVKAKRKAKAAMFIYRQFLQGVRKAGAGHHSASAILFLF